MWSLMYATRVCFPTDIDVERRSEAAEIIERICREKLSGKVIVEEMTDQIDVYRDKRRLATYMAVE